MHRHDAKGRQPLGAGGADVVLAQHLQHGRARHARHHRQRVGAQHDGRQHQVLQRRKESLGFARHQRVEQQKAGHRLDVVHHVQAPRHWRPSQVDREEHDQQQPPPENRHGVASEGDRHDTVVKPRIAFHGGNDAGRNAQQQRKRNGADRQFDGGRKQRQKFVHHRHLGDDGLAQVTLQHAANVDAVLRQHRLVQAVFHQQRSVARGVDAALAGHGFNRVARHQADQEKRQQRHAKEGGNEQADTGQEESQHRGMMPQKNPCSRHFIPQATAPPCSAWTGLRQPCRHPAQRPGPHPARQRPQARRTGRRPGCSLWPRPGVAWNRK